MNGDDVSKLSDLLSRARPEYFGALQSGVKTTDFAPLEAMVGQPLPDTFRQLYEWRNGQAATCSEPLQENRSFMPLEEIVETKSLLDSMIGFDFTDPAYWRTGWIPFLHNGGGSYLCLDLLAAGGGRPGQLLGFWKADRDRPVEHPSLDAWLQCLVSALERGTLELY